MKEYVEVTWGWDDTFQQNYFAQNFDITGCQIVLINGRKAGQITTIDQGQNIFISAIYLLPEFQNYGIGSALLKQVLKKAERFNVTVTLRVLKANEPAYRLYKRLGFIETADKLTHRMMKWQPPSANPKKPKAPS